MSSPHQTYFSSGLPPAGVMLLLEGKTAQTYTVVKSWSVLLRYQSIWIFIFWINICSWFIPGVLHCVWVTALECLCLHSGCHRGGKDFPPECNLNFPMIVESVLCTSSSLLRARYEIPHCSRWEQFEFHSTCDFSEPVTDCSTVHTHLVRLLQNSQHLIWWARICELQNWGAVD